MFLVDTSVTFGVDFIGDISVGDVTIDITRANGTLLVDDGATTDNNDGTYDYTLSAADNSQIDILRLDWTIVSTSEVVTTHAEIVGDLLFTIDQARTFKAKADATTGVIPLNSATEYPDARIATERARITDDLEEWTGRSWIRRYARVELGGNGQRSLPLFGGKVRASDGRIIHRPGHTRDIDTLISASIGSTSPTLANIKVGDGELIRTDGTWARATTSDPFNVTVEYVYGLPYPVDGVDRIALELLVDRLVPSAFPDRMISADTEFGSVRYVQPGGPMKNVSRLPEVNHWVATRSMRIPVL